MQNGNATGTWIREADVMFLTGPTCGENSEEVSGAVFPSPFSLPSPLIIHNDRAGLRHALAEVPGLLSPGRNLW